MSLRIKSVPQIALVSVAVVIVLLTVWYVAADRKIETIVSLGNYVVYDNEQDLFDASELVVIAKPIGKLKNVVIGEGMDRLGYTLSEIEIKEVLKPSARQDVPKNAVIEVTEPYYIVEKRIAPGKKKFIPEDYTELKPNALYVLYLTWDKRSNTFGIYTGPQGKYNIDGYDADEEAVKDGHIQNLKSEVLKKYKDKVNMP